MDLLAEALELQRNFVEDEDEDPAVRQAASAALERSRPERRRMTRPTDEDGVRADVRPAQSRGPAAALLVARLQVLTAHPCAEIRQSGQAHKALLPQSVPQ